MIFMFLLCVFYTLKGLFHKRLKKESGVIIAHSGWEKVYSILYWKEIIGNSLTNPWLDIDWRTRKKNGYVDIRKLLQTFSGAWQLKYFAL